MNDSQNRRREMLGRVRDFGVARTADFAPTSLGAQIIAGITSAITNLDGLAASQASGIGTARQGTATRSEARAGLREDLEAISRTAKAMALDTPGIENKFRIFNREPTQG